METTYTVLIEYADRVECVEYEDINLAIFFSRMYCYWPGVWTVEVVDTELWGTTLYRDGVCVDL